MTRLLAVCVATLAAAGAAYGQAPVADGPPQTPPRLCRGSAFVDLVGDGGRDRITAPGGASRLWGLGGRDVLTGSRTRVSCLLGGRGSDELVLGAGGGVALGDSGRDTVTGSRLGDVIDPGADTDAVTAAGGDDKLTVRDGRPEVVDCGPGDDQVKADRADVLVRCESTNLAGHSLRQVPVRPARVRVRGTVRFRVRLKGTAEPARYRILWLDDCRTPGVRDLGARRGRRSVMVRLTPPAPGWCRGRVRLVLARDFGQGLPSTPVARLEFTVR